jgi:hypothetical protein
MAKKIRQDVVTFLETILQLFKLPVILRINELFENGVQNLNFLGRSSNDIKFWQLL